MENCAHRIDVALLFCLNFHTSGTLVLDTRRIAVRRVVIFVYLVYNGGRGVGRRGRGWNASVLDTVLVGARDEKIAVWDGMRAHHAARWLAGRADNHVVPVGVTVGKRTIQLILFKMGVEKEPPILNLIPLAHHGPPKPLGLCHRRLPGPTRQSLGRFARP
jgi:hypothetical protein